MTAEQHADPALLEVVRAAGLEAGGVESNSALAAEYRMDASRTVTEFGRTLSTLHALPVPGPTTTVIDARAVASGRRAALDSGELADHELSAAYRHLSVDRLVSILEDGTAAATERAVAPVPTHGRPCLESFRWERWNPIGLEDWSHLAVADRNRDLAVVARSIVIDMDPAFLPAFFDAYGHEHLDLLQLDWYSLALELEPWAD